MKKKMIENKEQRDERRATFWAFHYLSLFGLKFPKKEEKISVRNSREERAALYQANKERELANVKAYYTKNKEKISARKKVYRQENKEKIAAQAKVYRQKNKEKIKVYRQENREKRKLAQRERIKNDLNFRMVRRLRSRVHKALKRNTKAGPTMELIGCSVEKLWLYLEGFFEAGMTRENNGNGDKFWHLDHKKPCAKFDLTDPEQQKLCFHYSNLRPMWATDNLIKGAKYEENNY
jgi:hypothetical protein